jgi:carboxymethylenebutenolidase
MPPILDRDPFSSAHAVLALIAILALGMAASEPDGIVESDASFKSRGKEYIVDVFAPNGPGKYPAVVVVHGHGGVGAGKRSGSHALARDLARAGYVALVPHYFGSLKPDSKDGRKNARSFAVWERTVSDTVGYAARRPDVDPRRIGLLGSSLGSWVSLSVAARDRRVSAVVENFGGWPAWEELNPTRLPPVLVLHGDADTNVPVEEAYKLEQILQEASVSYEMKIYPGAGHGFRGDDREDALKRTVEFFDTHVKRAARAATPHSPRPERSSRLRSSTLRK